jgi:hypothetical protein
MNLMKKKAGIVLLLFVFHTAMAVRNCEPIVPINGEEHRMAYVGGMDCCSGSGMAAVDVYNCYSFFGWFSYCTYDRTYYTDASTAAQANAGANGCNGLA